MTGRSSAATNCGTHQHGGRRDSNSFSEVDRLRRGSGPEMACWQYTALNEVSRSASNYCGAAPTDPADRAVEEMLPEPIRMGSTGQIQSRDRTPSANSVCPSDGQSCTAGRDRSPACGLGR